MEETKSDPGNSKIPKAQSNKIGTEQTENPFPENQTPRPVMGEKRRDAGNSPAGPSSAEPEPESTRRRAGAQKRKANSLSGSSSSSTPSKRVTREKSNLIFHPPINHYLTRARQGAPSGNLAFGLGSGSRGTRLEETSLVKESVKSEDLDELNKASEEWEALEAKIEAEFEAVRYRNSNAHVVPNHCG